MPINHNGSFVFSFVTCNCKKDILVPIRTALVITFPVNRISLFLIN